MLHTQTTRRSESTRGSCHENVGALGRRQWSDAFRYSPLLTEIALDLRFPKVQETESSHAFRVGK
jgi:hypothetical protein